MESLAGVKLMQNYNENAYERYRRRVEVLRNCDVKKTGSFIDNGEQSTEVRVERTQENIPVAMVMSHKEGADELYVFCHYGADFNVLDYFVWTDKNGDEHHFFASEQVMTIRDMDYRKLKCFECNVKVNEAFWAYFKGPMRVAKDTGFTSNYEESKMLPIMICPTREELNIGKHVIINKQTWRIVEADTYSIAGLGFYTLNRALNDNNEEEMLQDEVNIVYVGQILELPTTDGYYSTNSSAVELLSRTANKVKIKIIDTADLIVITTKENGENIENWFESKETV